MQFKHYDENKPKLNINTKNGVTFLTSPFLENIPFLTHGISTRLGGVSSGVCSSMNLAYNGIDDPLNVAGNYELLSSAAGIDVNKIVRPKQVHGTNVKKVTADHTFLNIRQAGFDFQETDGLITNVPGITLFSFSADCSLIMICDPVNRAIGQCHSGWRGTAGRISAVTIKMMSEEYGSDPSDLIVTIAPSICPECFEVEWDMIEKARESFRPDEYDRIYYRTDDVKYRFNLWEANKIVLMDAGVPESHIFMPNMCTKCNPDTLFSHRNSGLQRGTLAAFMEIK